MKIVATKEPCEMQKEDGIEALARFVKYCEAEAAGLNLSFVAYCLSIAKDALAEEVNPALRPALQNHS